MTSPTTPTPILAGGEAFAPEEIGTRYVRRCTRCHRPYGAGDYAEHADRYHNSGRTAYWRQRERDRAGGTS